MSFFNTDSQVEHFLRSFRDLSQGLYNLGKAALTIAEVNQKTLPMLQRMDHLMEKFEPLADHAIECMKKELANERFSPGDEPEVRGPSESDPGSDR